MIWALVAVCAVASVPASLRWLRVGQREHYHPASVSRFAWRWWTSGPINIALGGLTLVGLIGTLWEVWPGFLVAMAQLGPVGLGIRGRTSKLAWTPRLTRVGAAVGGLIAAIMLAGGVVESAFLVAGVLALIPVVCDLCLALLAPLEEALGSKWVDKATRKLASVKPRVVAITGSYGKTTTKGYLAHLASGSMRTVATPQSFNNRMGLARAVNEALTPGTELFVAEMGTYGPGEIAEMCRWVKPEIAVIVSLGPVHLERFRTEERVVEAKSEILDGAEIGVICVDHPLLARLAEQRREMMRIIEVSTGDRGVVQVTDDGIVVEGQVLSPMPEGVFAANLAAAVGACLSLGLAAETWLPRLTDLPAPAHRQTTSVGDAGFVIIDDTFNSNPAGARRALRLLTGAGTGQRAVVTPGMVELGPRQDLENADFSTAASQVADHLVIVGMTNRASLLRGASKGPAAVTVVDSREEAVAWARANLGPGDAVLYENDLPDHYP